MPNEEKNASVLENVTTGSPNAAKYRICGCFPPKCLARTAAVMAFACAMLTALVMHSDIFPFRLAVRASSALLAVLLTATFVNFLVRGTDAHRRSVDATAWNCISIVLLGVVHILLTALLVYRCQPKSCWQPRYGNSDRERAQSIIQMDIPGTLHTGILAGCFITVVLCFVILLRYLRFLKKFRSCSAHLPERADASPTSETTLTGGRADGKTTLGLTPPTKSFKKRVLTDDDGQRLSGNNQSDEEEVDSKYSDRHLRVLQRAATVCGSVSLVLTVAFSLYTHVYGAVPSHFGSVALPAIVTAAFTNFVLNANSEKQRHAWGMCAAMVLFGFTQAGHFVALILRSFPMNDKIRYQSSGEYDPNSERSHLADRRLHKGRTTGMLIAAVLAFSIVVTIICIAIFLRFSYCVAKHYSPSSGGKKYFAKLAAIFTYISSVFTAIFVHRSLQPFNQFIAERFIQAACPLLVVITTATFVRFFTSGIREQRIPATTVYCVVSTFLAVSQLALILQALLRCRIETCSQCPCDEAANTFLNMDEKNLVYCLVLTVCLAVTIVCSVLLWCYRRFRIHSRHVLPQNLQRVSCTLDEAVQLVSAEPLISIKSSEAGLKYAEASNRQETSGAVRRKDETSLSGGHDKSMPTHCCCGLLNATLSFNTAAVSVFVLMIAFTEFAQFFYYDPFSRLSLAVAIVATLGFITSLDCRKRRYVLWFFTITVLFAITELAHVTVFVVRSKSSDDPGFFWIREQLTSPSKYWVATHSLHIAGIFALSFCVTLVCSFAIWRYAKLLSEVRSRMAASTRGCPPDKAVVSSRLKRPQKLQM